MADEIVYRLIAGEGVQLLENSSTKTVTVSVPSLDQKLNVGDIGQASTAGAGIVELATDTEVRAGTDTARAVTPSGLAAASQSSDLDSTAGRILRVGGFGVGVVSQQPNWPNTSLNDCTGVAAGMYRTVSGTTDLPAGIPGSACTVEFRIRVSSGGSIQLVQEITHAGSMYKAFRGASGGTAPTMTAPNWSGWCVVHHSGNFDPATKANVSGSYPGLDVGNSSTVGGQTAAMLSPPGAVSMFAMASPPSGWLKANGAAVSRTTYAALFANIGTTWGAGNGSTTFNLPDFRGIFLRPWDDGRGLLDPGRAYGTVQTSQNLTHAHTAGTDQQGQHAHSVYGVGDHAHILPMYNATGIYNGPGGSGPNLDGGANSIATGPGGSHTHGMDAQGLHWHNITVAASGGLEARPTNVALLCCIKY